MDILCVKSHHGVRYGLPGGKRDRQGVGRSEFQQGDEPCIVTAMNEFREEIGEDLSQFFVYAGDEAPMPHFDVTLYRNNQ